MLTKLDMSMLSVLGVVIVVSAWVGSTMNQAVGGQESVGAERSLALKPKKVEKKEAENRPDFKSMVDVKQKKKAFFDYMLPMVVAQNNQLLSLRSSILSLKEKRKLDEKDQQWLKSQAEDYDVEIENGFDASFFKQLLSRVDIIPVSLVLAQSANESAWGTSRYAVDGSNFFGQWCFSKGCGLVPRRRPAGATYEVRKFSSVSDSVRSYMHNLNTQESYEGLRMLRSSKRSSGETITGSFLAQGLTKYSSRGQDYVNELVAMITGNDLVQFDVQEDNSEILSYRVE